MDDLIRREDALDCFHCWVDKHGDVYTPDDIPEYRAIEALPAVEPKPQWIPCSERLPENDQMCLISVRAEDGHCDVYKGYYCTYQYIKRHGAWRIDDSLGYFVSASVTAWMPLPEPYEVEK